MLCTWARAVGGNVMAGQVIDIDDSVGADHINNRWAVEYDPESETVPVGASAPAALSAAAAAAVAAAAAATAAPATDPATPPAS